MIKTEEDLRLIYDEETGLPIVTEDEKQWYANWLERKYINDIKNIESSSHVSQQRELLAAFVKDWYKNNSFVDEAKQLKMVDEFLADYSG